MNRIFKNKCGVKTLGSSRNWHLCPHKRYRAFQDLGRVGQGQGIGNPELAYGPSLIICREAIYRCPEAV